jgi:thiol-disulfide isomerase/thioredoxin
MRQKSVSILGLVVVIAVVLAGCAASSRAPEERGADVAYDFDIVVYQGADALGGDAVRLSEVLAQGRPVVLNMWAGLCPVCRIEMPVLQQVYEEYGDRVLVVGIDLGPFVGLGSEEDARALLDELGITFPAGTTPDAAVVREYEVIGIPAAYFVTPGGQIVQQQAGALTEEELGEHVEALIEASGGP